jgi:hypothetical protein
MCIAVKLWGIIRQMVGWDRERENCGIMNLMVIFSGNCYVYSS